MANPTTTTTRRHNGGAPDATVDFGLEATRNAQETMLRSVRVGVDTTLTLTDVGQRVGRELMALGVTGAKQMLQLWAEVQGSTLDAVNRFAESMQGRAEEGTERIKQAVDVMADQIKDGAVAIGQAVENESNRTRAAAG